LVDFLRRFYKEVILIPDLEQREMSLVEALKKDADFIRATEIYWKGNEGNY